MIDTLIVSWAMRGLRINRGVVISRVSDCFVTLHVDTGGVANSMLDTPRMLGSNAAGNR